MSNSHLVAKTGKLNPKTGSEISFPKYHLFRLKTAKKYFSKKMRLISKKLLKLRLYDVQGQKLQDKLHTFYTSSDGIIDLNLIDTMLVCLSHLRSIY